MKILLDADGSPVRKIVEDLSKKYGARLVTVKNYSQDFTPSYGQVVDVDVTKGSCRYLHRQPGKAG